MQIDILSPLDTNEVILFFGGFYTHKSFFSHLKTKMGVVLLSNYQDRFLNLDFLNNKKIILVAWSMGVAMANRFLPKTLNIHKSIAINGTNYGIHKTLGIPPPIFAHTIKHFNEKLFIKMLFEGHLKQTKNFIFNTNANIELEKIYTLLTSIPPKSLKWDKIIISSNDKIFQTKYQKNAWENQKYDLIDAPHFVFFNFQSWEDLCNL